MKNPLVAGQSKSLLGSGIYKETRKYKVVSSFQSNQPHMTTGHTTLPFLKSLGWLEESAIANGRKPSTF